jgi:hypothetical protein
MRFGEIMKVNVIVTREESIPKTAEVTGVPEAEIRAKFDECHRFGKPYVFLVDMDEAQLKAAEENLNRG